MAPLELCHSADNKYCDMQKSNLQWYSACKKASSNTLKDLFREGESFNRHPIKTPTRLFV